MIQCNGLTKVFKIGQKHKEDFAAVEGLSLEIPQGQVFGFLGPNGAGKTTTVRMLTALIRPSRGTAKINGYELGREDTQIRRSVGILTESPGMYERLSAEMNLSLFAKLYDVPDVPAAVGKYLNMLGLWERRHDPVGSFSKGMRQKLAIARALVHEPRTLFLDEPTTGLDPEAAKTIRDFIEELKTEGRTIFMTTHNLDEADKLCDIVGIFQQKLIALDTPAALRSRLFGRTVVFHLGAVNPDWPTQLSALDGVKKVEKLENKLVVSLDDPEKQNPAIIRKLVELGADLQFVGEVRHSLEQIYLETLRAPKEEKL
ncbi:MAG TPA: ABC transporter ATP-binding protein [Anaerolineaceae bacterium]|nr:ABC transporter ATP-binding protein [Anaerolineaceae bacterium]